MIIQRSDEWIAERLGVLTSTRAASLMSKAARATLMAEMIAEFVTATGKDIPKTSSMVRGSEIEPEAVRYYEMQNNCDVYGCDDYLNGDLDGFSHRIATSPDGLIGDDGGLEIKSLDRHNHLKVLLYDKIDPKHEHQIRWHLMVTDRQWWDYFGYCPDLPEPLTSYTKRIFADVGIQDEYKEAARVFLEDMDDILDKYGLRI